MCSWASRNTAHVSAGKKPLNTHCSNWSAHTVTQPHYTAEGNNGAIVAIVVCLTRTFIEPLFFFLFPLRKLTDLQKAHANWTWNWSLNQPMVPLQFGTTHCSGWLIPKVCVLSGIFNQDFKVHSLWNPTWPNPNLKAYMSLLLYLHFCFNGLQMWTDLNGCSVSVQCCLTANTGQNIAQANV